MAQPERLSPSARAVLLSNEAEIWVSPVSAWEASQKWAAGKLRLPGVPSVIFSAWMAREGVQELPFKFDSVWTGQTLPWTHADPFDRMLASQAVTHELTLVTPDRALHAYPIQVVW
jgi:PIN domain nuclease of toxin-antitoxin system